MVNDKQSTNEDFLLDGQVIEEVSEFGYLGLLINTKSDSTDWQLQEQPLRICSTYGKLCFLLLHTASCESWAPTKMTIKGLRLLNCGATEDFSVYPGRIKEPTTGCWRRFAPHSS